MLSSLTFIMLQPIHNAPFLPIPDRNTILHVPIQHRLAAHRKHPWEHGRGRVVEHFRRVRPLDRPSVLVRVQRDEIRPAALLCHEHALAREMDVDGFSAEGLSLETDNASKSGRVDLHSPALL